MAGARRPAAKPVAATPATEHTYWVQPRGSKAPVKLVTRAVDVGGLVKDVKRDLELSARLQDITLQLAALNKDKDEQLMPLDSMDTMDEALAKAKEVLGRNIDPTEKLRILVDVAAPAAAVYPAGSPAAVLLAALPFAKLEPVPGHDEDGCQVLALYDARGEPVNWPKLKSNKLIVRPVFREFFERADMFNFGKPRQPITSQLDTLVLGIPGIGKSSFGLYCLWRLAILEKRHVLYDYPTGLDADETLEFGSGPRDNAVYIADGVVPRKIAGINLLVSSPRQEIFDEFKKDAVRFFMPEPTREETLIVRDVGFPHLTALLTDSVIDEGAGMFGSVLRVLMQTPASWRAELDNIKEGLEEGPLRRLLKQGEETGVKKDVFFRVLHYRFNFDTAAPYRWSSSSPASSRDYTKVSLGWASSTMEDCVFDFLYRTDHQSRIDLLSDLLKDKEILAFSSKLWERWIQRRGDSLPGGALSHSQTARFRLG